MVPNKWQISKIYFNQSFDDFPLLFIINSLNDRQGPSMMPFQGPSMMPFQGPTCGSKIPVSE